MVKSPVTSLLVCNKGHKGGGGAVVVSLVTQPQEGPKPQVRQPLLPNQIRNKSSLFRLHKRQNAHLLHKLKIGQSEKCPCNAGPMTTEHLVRLCPLHDGSRECSTARNHTNEREQLYGDLEELERTTAIVKATGVNIWRKGLMKENNRARISRDNYHLACGSRQGI